MEPTSPLCGFCIGEDHLAAQIRRRGAVAVCASCGLRRRTGTLERIASEVDDAYRRYYSSVLEGGEFPDRIIGDMLEAEDHDIAEAIVDFLHQNEYRDIADGADAFYAGTGYVMREIYAYELDHTWEEFRRRVQFEQRFFDTTARGMLEEIFQPVRDLAELGVTAPIVTLDPGDQTAIFRARLAKNRDEARRFLADPAAELSAPHPAVGRPGRLNPAGLPVFYGAFSRATCMSEVRPSVGAVVVTAEFRVTRRVKLLDFTAFERNWPSRSIFELGFEDEIARWAFLTEFQRVIAQPVQPAEEAIEYIPTQAVADYIYSELKLDGLIYPSAQTDSDPWSDEPFSDQNVAFLRVASAAELGGPTALERELAMAVPLLGAHQVPVARAEPEPAPRPLLEFVDDSAWVHSIRGIEFDVEREFGL